MRMRLCVCVAALLACAGAEPPRAEKQIALNPCISKGTCDQCVRTPGCAWCWAPDFPAERSRCFLPQNNTNICDEAYVYNPPSLQHTLDPKYNLPLTKGSHVSQAASGEMGGAWHAGTAEAAAGARVVQVRPQRLKMQLRMNEEQRISVEQAQDYPVDLYYLMDLSKSMENDKEKLSKLGQDLAATMHALSPNFRLGFGSFVDKTVMPYISTVPEKMVTPCENCATPYSFRNEMSLSADTAYFSQAVSRANVSGNLDAPEGGFDAIMQSVVCEQIGWREGARKLLVFSTDASFHYAGDGKLGGIIQPNDGKCHYDGGSYDHYSLGFAQDYPSISQINLKVKENAINVIFAVTKEQHSVYQELEKHIVGSRSGVLDEDSGNIVQLVGEQYNKISSNVKMTDNSTSSVRLTYWSSCLGGGPLEKTNECDGLKVGDVVEFKVDIELTSCPADRSKWNPIIAINPVGISEALYIELEMLCDCPCERPGHEGYRERAVQCSSRGKYMCGVCDCGADFYGHACECSVASGNMTSLADNCRRPGDQVDCSGRGVCICGKCDCNKGPPSEEITGKFCECDNFSCDRKNSQLCDGHGTCLCGMCVCAPGWGAADCSCTQSNVTCIGKDGLVCNGHGRCECGTCVCDEPTDGDKESYAGQFCTECRTCTAKCEEFKDCVLCTHFKKGPLSEEDCEKNCSRYHIKAVETLQATDDDKISYMCTYLDDQDCRYSYKYEWPELNHSMRDVYILVQEKLECPPPVYILGIVLGVIAAIVLVGLALLMLWKMVTTIHDRREFARFEKERAMAKWDTGENPIYKQATSTFKNPTYQGK